ncbi:MAG: nuclear transport factor 2 family protein [Steroidobacteraceae bacterium]
MSASPVVEQWHRVVRERDEKALWNLLDDDATFHSPVVHTPQRGRQLTYAYLYAAMQVFSGESFRYVREVAGERDAVLEFQLELDGIVVNGVDMIRWNDEGRIVDFKVMLRPLKAVNLIHQKMGEALGVARKA